jgi:hypothetical protein
MKGKFTAIKYCNWCGDPFEVKSPNQKYCHHDNKNCSQEAKRESWRKAAGKYRKKYNVLQISQVYKLGSGLLSSKPNEDFDKEYLAVVKEKKRLKLNGVIIGLSTGIQFAVRPLEESPLQRNLLPLLELCHYLLVLAILLVGIVVFGIYYE